MTAPHDDLLTTTEGVDEGSAASTAGTTGPGAPTATDPAAARTSPADQPPSGHTPDESDAPPLDMESAGSRAARAQAPGQELAEGEGGAA